MRRRSDMCRLRSTHYAFTLTELLIAIGIVTLLAAIALPAMSRARVRSGDAVFVSDLKQAGDAFILFAQDHGEFPADVGPGQIPAGAATYLPKNLAWTKPTSIGGRWDWDYNQFGGMTGVSVHTPDRTVEQMTVIDESFDDGALDAGGFHVRPNGYILLLDR